MSTSGGTAPDRRSTNAGHGRWGRADPWRTGYSFFWLAGVATPTAQIDIVDVNAPQNVISSYGSVFVHGATTGLEARW